MFCDFQSQLFGSSENFKHLHKVGRLCGTKVVQRTCCAKSPDFAVVFCDFQSQLFGSSEIFEHLHKVGRLCGTSFVELDLKHLHKVSSLCVTRKFREKGAVRTKEPVAIDPIAANILFLFRFSARQKKIWPKAGTRPLDLGSCLQKLQ